MSSSNEIAECVGDIQGIRDIEIVPDPPYSS